jgi:hypothetical protein
MEKEIIVTVISRIDRMRPSEYEELFYAECASRGAKYICKKCGYWRVWQKEKNDKPIRCENPNGTCNGAMVLTINKKEVEADGKSGD